MDDGAELLLLYRIRSAAIDDIRLCATIAKIHTLALEIVTRHCGQGVWTSSRGRGQLTHRNRHTDGVQSHLERCENFTARWRWTQRPSDANERALKRDSLDKSSRQWHNWSGEDKKERRKEGRKRTKIGASLCSSRLYSYLDSMSWKP